MNTFRGQENQPKNSLGREIYGNLFFVIPNRSPQQKPIST